MSRPKKIKDDVITREDMNVAALTVLERDTVRVPRIKWLELPEIDGYVNVMGIDTLSCNIIVAEIFVKYSDIEELRFFNLDKNTWIEYQARFVELEDAKSFCEKWLEKMWKEQGNV